MPKLGVDVYGGETQDIGEHLSDPPALSPCIKLLAWAAALRREEVYTVYTAADMACVWTCSRVLARDLQTVSMTAFLLAQPWPWPTPLLGFVPARSNQGARNTSRDLLQYNRVCVFRRTQYVDEAVQVAARTPAKQRPLLANRQMLCTHECWTVGGMDGLAKSAVRRQESGVSAAQAT